ncbi:hypothetical protein KC722_03560, partial [Candidatus Kaiserbacteria bacterium]|nr:hypothetical protein [Candidatus Kaiserbacteria bacterium]
MQPEIIPATTTNADGVIIPSADLAVDSVFGNAFDSFGVGSFVSMDGVLAFLNVVWSYYTIIAYIFSIILLMIYV